MANYPDWLEERFGDDIQEWAEDRWGDEEDEEDTEEDDDGDNALLRSVYSQKSKLNGIATLIKKEPSSYYIVSNFLNFNDIIPNIKDEHTYIFNDPIYWGNGKKPELKGLRYDFEQFKDLYVLNSDIPQYATLIFNNNLNLYIESDNYRNVEFMRNKLKDLIISKQCRIIILANKNDNITSGLLKYVDYTYYFINNNTTL